MIQSTENQLGAVLYVYFVPIYYLLVYANLAKIRFEKS